MNSHAIHQKRRDIRIELTYGKGEISIIRIRNLQVHSKGKPVLLLDISPGGLRFQTDLVFPVCEHIILLCKAQLIKNVWVELEGRIVWRKRSENLFEYGFEMIIQEQHRILLIRLLNELLLNLIPKQQKIHSLYRSMSGMKMRR